LLQRKGEYTLQQSHFELVKTKGTTKIKENEGYLYFFDAHEQELRVISKHGTNSQKEALSMAIFYWEQLAQKGKTK
jgi:hypothetical protein